MTELSLTLVEANGYMNRLDFEEANKLLKENERILLNHIINGEANKAQKICTITLKSPSKYS